MTADRPDAADYGDAFLDVAREWQEIPGPHDVEKLFDSTAEDFAAAVEARAAQYAERPAGDSLDAAWAAAEAALPEGWWIVSLHPEEEANGEYNGPLRGEDRFAFAAVQADPNRDHMWADYREVETGPTPAAALRALTAKLGEGEG